MWLGFGFVDGVTCYFTCRWVATYAVWIAFKWIDWRVSGALRTTLHLPLEPCLHVAFCGVKRLEPLFFRSSFVLERRRLDPNFTLNGKSKSLDDLILPGEANKKSKNISLLEVGRANTYDDQAIHLYFRQNELNPFLMTEELFINKQSPIFFIFS